MNILQKIKNYFIFLFKERNQERLMYESIINQCVGYHIDLWDINDTLYQNIYVKSIKLKKSDLKHSILIYNDINKEEKEILFKDIGRILLPIN